MKAEDAAAPPVLGQAREPGGHQLRRPRALQQVGVGSLPQGPGSPRTQGAQTVVPLNERRLSNPNAIYYLGSFFQIGLRAGRITELLRDESDQGLEMSLEDLKRLQADVRLGRRRPPPLLP